MFRSRRVNAAQASRLRPLSPLASVGQADLTALTPSKLHPKFNLRKDHSIQSSTGNQPGWSDSQQRQIVTVQLIFGNLVPATSTPV